MDQNTLENLSSNSRAEILLERSARTRGHQLAYSLQSQGEKALLKGNLKKGLECFDAVLKLNPFNPKIYYEQGLALFEFGSEEGREKALLIASKKLKKAIGIKPDHFDAWQIWASVLNSLGIHFEEHHYFQEAKEKIDKAISLSQSQINTVLSDLYWEAGIIYSHLAEHSEEPFDMHFAIQAFEKAHSYEKELPADFWSDFGYSYLKFAIQVNDIRFLIKAIQSLKSAISLDAKHFESWCLLGETLQKLYETTHDEEHFKQADECFTMASSLNPQDIDLWIDWAQFLCDSAKRVGDPKRLRFCIEKCHHVHALDETNPTARAILAEAMALLGNYTENLDLIHEAENKIEEALALDSDSPDVWYSYGICMQTMAHYFNEYDYYYQAIEKFQTGLSIDRTCHRHWHAIGWTYLHIGENDADPEALELSLKFFEKAIDLHRSTYYLFDYAVALSKLGEMLQDQSRLEQSIAQFERLFQLQKNAVYLHPDWLFHFACTLDALGDFSEEDSHYLKAIEIFSHVLMVDPDFTHVHHRLGIALSHLGEFTEEVEHFYRAIHHFQLALKNDEENDLIFLDWATALINQARYTHDSEERELSFRDAEYKLLQAIRLGNLQSHYLLACLNSLMGNYEKAMRFLMKAYVNHSLPTIEEMYQDEWLEDLISTPSFQEFISGLERRRNYQEEC